MRDGAGGHASDLLRRITGESDAHDALARVAHELRRRHDDIRERRRRQRSAEVAENNPRRGVRRVHAAGPPGARR